MKISFPRMQNLIFSLLVMTFLCSAQTVHAGFTSLDVFDHPNDQGTALSWGLALGVDGEHYIDYFTFKDVTMTVDTTPGGTGRAVVSGTVVHNMRYDRIIFQGGQVIATPNQEWRIEAVYDNIRYKPGFGTATPFRNDPLPDDDMFQDLLDIGKAWGPDRDFLIWDSTTLTMTPLVANPLYDRSRSLVQNHNHPVLGGSPWPSPNGQHPNWLGYRTYLENGFPGSQNDILTQHLVWETAGDLNVPNYTRGDFNVGFNINSPPSQVIPEPATMVLMGMGMAGMGVMRKRKQNKKS